MKRLLITLEYPPDVGGIAEYYKGLVEALPQGSMHVMTPRDTWFFTRSIWPHWLPLLASMWRAFRRERPDELWIGQILPIGTVVWILKKLRLTAYPLPLTIFFHGMDILMCQKTRWKKFLAEQILQNATRVVANSNYTKGELVKFGVPEEKIRVVYPCPRIKYQVSSIKYQELQKRYGLEDKRVLLTAARLVRRKGVDLVIDALQEVANKVPNLVYVVVGDGPERKALQRASSSQHRAVVFTGAVTDLAERAAWFSLADVYISTPRTLPHDVESFGLVYLEANLFGKPVIGSRSGGVPEAVVDLETGLLVPEENMHAIAEAIIQLMTNTTLAAQLGAEGKQRAENEFIWRKQIQKLA